jgi:DNA-binding transcriptional MerR regulator
MIENRKTPGELSQTLGVTTATLRNYVSHFGEFLSPEATRKTRKRFTPEDAQTLQAAKSLLDDGLTYDQAAAQLQTQPLTGEVIEDFQTGPEPEPANDLPPSAMQTREFYEQFFKPALDAKDETISELKQDKDRLQHEIAWLRLPWWKRAFRDPPE